MTPSSTGKSPRISPYVSIITPAYNVEAFLAETAASVLAQSFADFEWLIVDDGSTDRTRALVCDLAHRDPRIHLIAAPNSGPAAARNVALRAARGAFLALLDSDDSWYPDYLASQLTVFELRPDAAIVTANAVNDGGGRRYDGLPFWPVTSGLRTIVLRELIEEEDAVCVMSIMQRRVYETLGGFDEAFNGNEDYEFWLRAALAGFVIVQNRRPLGVYRRRYDSLSGDEPRMINGVMKVLRHVQPFVANDPEARLAVARQLHRFDEELPRAELRALLQRKDAVAAARVLQSLSTRRGGWILPAVARVGAAWPQSLLWAYKLRRAVRA